MCVWCAEEEEKTLKQQPIFAHLTMHQKLLEFFPQHSLQAYGHYHKKLDMPWSFCLKICATTFSFRNQKPEFEVSILVRVSSSGSRSFQLKSYLRALTEIRKKILNGTRELWLEEAFHFQWIRPILCFRNVNRKKCRQSSINHDGYTLFGDIFWKSSFNFPPKKIACWKLWYNFPCPQKLCCSRCYPLALLFWYASVCVCIFFGQPKTQKHNEVKMRSFQTVIEICARFFSLSSFILNLTFCNHHKSTGSSSINLNAFQFMAWNLLLQLMALPLTAAAASASAIVVVFVMVMHLLLLLPLYIFVINFSSSSSSFPLLWWFNMFHQMTQKPHLLEVTLFEISLSTNTHTETYLVMWWCLWIHEIYLSKWAEAPRRGGDGNGGGSVVFLLLPPFMSLNCKITE